MTETICNNLQKIQHRIETICNRSGRDPSDVMIVAVSKTKPVASIEAALNCGQYHIGENRVAELQEKMDQIDRENLVWHFVGPMQTNKIKYLVNRVDWIQSVYKKKYLKEIEKRASRIDRVIQTLIQVNISGEEQKQGCTPEDLPEILEYAQDLNHLRVRGLMGMATFTNQADVVRSEFRLLKETLDENIRYNKGSVQLEHLSMGMTNDLEIAIEEGSTMVRIGTAIFGERDQG